MKPIIYCGDWHGSAVALTYLQEVAQEVDACAIVQCGDFGIFWPGHDLLSPVLASSNFQVPIYFVDGNHENHDVLDQQWESSGRLDLVEVAENCFHMRRGTRHNIGGLAHVVCGGARSTDRDASTAIFQGRQIWWAQEAPSAEDILKFQSQLTYPVDVVVTHEAPGQIPLSRKGRGSDDTVAAFARLWANEQKPKLWVFGHHHQLKNWVTEETTFRCAGLHGQGFIRFPDGSIELLTKKV